MADEPPARDTACVLDEAGSDAVLDGLWAQVLAAWDVEAAHAALLAHALRTQQLPEIAGRYRGLVEDAERGVEAQKRVENVVVAATQLLMSMKTPRPGKVPLPITLSAVSVSMLLLAWLSWLVWGRH